MTHGPAVGRRRLGIELRKLRLAAKLDGKAAGETIGISASKISRLENGKTTLNRGELKSLLEAYGVTDADTQHRLHSMAQVAAEASWWDDYDDVLPSGLDTYMGLEEAVSELRSYTNHLVHGLVQTGDYARALIKAQRPRERADTVERLVELRLRRQQIFERAEPFTLWAITEETVLRRPVGGPALMARQLEHLLAMVEIGKVKLQVLPLSRGAHAGAAGPFTIMKFPEATDRDIVYVDSPAGNAYIQNPTAVGDYVERFSLLAGSALDQADSVALTHQILKEMT